MRVDDLRIKYKKFVYKSFKYNIISNNLVADFIYSIEPDIEFKHQIVVKSINQKEFEKLDKQILDNFLFNVGMVEIPSYWKTTCSPLIKVEAGNLSNSQISWWKKLYINGMMQYFYENKIDFRSNDFLNIVATGGGITEAKLKAKEMGNLLIPIGGGKDSAVTLGIIEETEGFNKLGSLVVGRISKSPYDLVKISDSSLVVTERNLDLQKIKDLNDNGYLNGHVPYSASLYFISLLAAYVFNYTNILFSNESSSNEGNLKYLGKEVNHQYSKTLEFEADFREYNAKYLSNINLFSFLRPLTELQISILFSKMKKYFYVIRSCNVGQKADAWCGKCPKCLSTYILLIPFLGSDTTNKIFDKNLFQDANLTNLLFNLIDDSKIKPFECVGTRKELRVALFMAAKQYQDKLPKLLKEFKDSNLYNESLLNKDREEIMSSFDQNYLPTKFKKILQKRL